MRKPIKTTENTIVDGGDGATRPLSLERKKLSFKGLLRKTARTQILQMNKTAYII